MKEKTSSSEWTDTLDKDWSLCEQCLHEVPDEHALEKTIKSVMQKKKYNGIVRL